MFDASRCLEDSSLVTIDWRGMLPEAYYVQMNKQLRTGAHRESDWSVEAKLCDRLGGC